MSSPSLASHAKRYSPASPVLSCPAHLHRPIVCLRSRLLSCLPREMQSPLIIPVFPPFDAVQSISTASRLNRILALQNTLLEPQQKNRLTRPHLIPFSRPMRSNPFRTKSRSITHTFNNPRHKRCTI